MMVILNAPTAGAMTGGARIAAAEKCIEGLLYYLAVYFFMNLGAFAIVALVRNQTYSEEVASFAGLSRQAPVLAGCMLICLISLVGIPQFGGFFGKLAVFYSVVEAADLNPVMWFVFAAGVFNTVLSLFYYLRIVKFMYFAPVPEGARPVDVPALSDAGWYVLFVSLPVFGLGIFVNWLSVLAHDVAGFLLKNPPV